MSAVWPSTLQVDLNTDNFGYQVGETAVSTDMDVGPSKKRRRFTKSVDEVVCSIDLAKSDYTTFYNFYDATLSGGTLPFQYANPFTDVVEDYRFKEPPKISPLNGGIVFRVEMSWIRLPV